ncbi:MAG TPA: FHA domain-containing protein [bacterium]|nr:FHA domain-containing protein [bacterium]
MAKITVLINDRPSRIYRVTQKITVGRDAANEIQILDQKVSRRHMTVEKRKGFFILKDLGSRNGTFLNDVRVSESELKAGDRIRVGNTNLCFGEDPVIDSVQNTDTGDIIVPGVASNGMTAFQYDPQKLRNLAEGSDRQAMKKIIHLLTDLAGFAGNGRTFESGSIIFQRLQDMIHTMLPVDRSFVLLKKQKEQGLQNVAVRSTLHSSHQPDFDNPVFHRVHEEGFTLYSGKGLLKPGESDDGTFRSSVRGALCVPLKSGAKILGMIYGDLSAGAETLTEEELMILSALAGIAGTHIEAWLNQQELNDRLLASLQIVSEIAESHLDLDGADGRAHRLAGSARMIADYMGLPDDQLDLISAASFIVSMMALSSAPVSLTETLPEDRSRDDAREAVWLRKMEKLPGLEEITRFIRLRSENFDGSGTPDGLAGNAIPLGSRILRAVILLEDIDTSDPAMMEASLGHFNGTILDPLVVRAIRQCATRLITKYHAKQ